MSPANMEGSRPLVNEKPSKSSSLNGPAFCTLDGRLTDAERATMLAFLLHEIHAHGAYKSPLRDRDLYMWRVPRETDLTKIFTGPVYPGVTIKYDPWNKVLVLEVMRPAGLGASLAGLSPWILQRHQTRSGFRRAAELVNRALRAIRQWRAR